MTKKKDPLTGPNTIDLYSPYDINLEASNQVHIKTGVICAIPEAGTVIHARISPALENSLIIHAYMMKHNCEIVVFAWNIRVEAVWLSKDYPIAQLTMVNKADSDSEQVKALNITNSCGGGEAIIPYY
jgi:dUTPase